MTIPDFCQEGVTPQPSPARTSNPTSVATAAPTTIDTGTPTSDLTSPPSTNPTSSPTGICGAGATQLTVKLVTDEYGSEISWNVTDIAGNTLLHGDYLEPYTTYVEKTCLPTSACYLFTISDTFGDGLGEDGEYSVSWEEEEQSPGTAFTHRQQFYFGDGACEQYTLAPSATPTVSTFAPTPLIEPCSNNKSRISVIVRTDNYPNETSWRITDLEGKVLLQSDPFDTIVTTYRDSICVKKDQCYLFTINDEYGDGFLNPGKYAVYWDGNKESKDAPFKFEQSCYVGGDEACEGYTISPTIAPTIFSLAPTQTLEPCPSTDSRISVVVYTDEYPYETSWNLKDLDGNIILLSDKMEFISKDYRKSICVPKTQCYLFTIKDEFGDGIINSGFYYVMWDGKQQSPNRPFTYAQYSYIGGKACDSFTLSPTIAPAPLTFAPTTVPEPCAGINQSRVTVTVYTDDYPAETSWQLINSKNGAIRLSDGNFYESNSRYSKSICLYNRQCYIFTIYDEFGDGILSDEKYSVTWHGEDLSPKTDYWFEQTLYVGGSYCDGYTQWPTWSPTISEFPSSIHATGAPTPQPEPCPEGESRLSIVIYLDEYPEETSWELRDSDGKKILKSEKYETGNIKFTQGICLPATECYSFIMKDSYGDGILSWEGYYLQWEGERFLSGTSFQLFDYEHTTYFGGSGCNSCGPGKKEFKIELKTDGYGGETYWDLLKKANGKGKFDFYLWNGTYMN